MLFTREALEQASAEPVAAWHASRFPPGAEVTDLTAGIGGDSIALAGRGPAIGYELDPERATYAVHNVRVYGRDARIFVGDAREAAWSDRVWLDPSRRRAGRRVRTLEDAAPSPAELRARLAAVRLAGIKLSPLSSDAELGGLGPEVEFVGYGGECREAVVWLGRETEPGRRAVLVETGERLEAGPSGLPGRPGAYLYDPHPAAVRAHALGTLARQYDLTLLGGPAGYLTGGPVQSPWLEGYRVLEAVPFDLKKLKAWLREHGARLAAVKSRAPGVRTEEVLRSLRTEGTHAVVLALYAEGARRRGLMLEPVEPLG